MKENRQLAFAKPSEERAQLRGRSGLDLSLRRDPFIAVRAASTALALGEVEDHRWQPHDWLGLGCSWAHRFRRSRTGKGDQQRGQQNGGAEQHGSLVK